MSKTLKARVFMNGRSQAVRIPLQYRFTGEEVYIHRDAKTGDVILSEAPGGWEEIFAALDDAEVPNDFLLDRKQGVPQKRANLFGDLTHG